MAEEEGEVLLAPGANCSRAAVKGVVQATKSVALLRDVR